MSFPYPKPFPGASAFAMAVAAVGGAALISGETQGLGIDFTYATLASQMEVVDTGTPANTGTFDPYSKLTYTSPSVKMCLQSDGVYRYGNHNLALRSQEIGNAAWGTKYEASVSSDATAAPDGTTTADKLVESVANDAHGLEQAITGVSGRTYQWSIYAKAAGRSWFQTNGGVNFDVTNGATGTVGAGYTASITSVGNGWYRCVWIGPASSSAIGFSLYLGTSNSTFVYSGNGSNGVYFWGAEVKTYPVQEPSGLSSYIATTSAAKYALPYEYNTAGVLQGIKPEEARTNLWQRSQEFDNGFWGTVDASISANAAVAPDGTTTADKLVDNVNSADHRLYWQGSLALSTTHAVSIFAKAAGRTSFSIQFATSDFTGGVGADFNLSNGTCSAWSYGSGVTSPVAPTITDVGNGWYRCTMTGNDSHSTTPWVLFELGTYVGNGSNGVYFWQAQCEVGTFASSPIHTIGATVTRAIDNIWLATTALPFSATAGTLVGYINAPSIAGSNCIFSSLTNGSDFNESIYIYYDPDDPTLLVFDGGVIQAQIDVGTAATGAAKLAAAWAANDFAASYNAGTVGTDGSGSLPTPTRLTLGGGETGAGGSFYLKQVTYLPRRATNTELQTRTT